MKGKLLAISILIIVQSPIFAQVELVSDGDVVAHGVRRCGWMPEALQHALAGRRMEVRQPQASTSFTHRARPVARCVRQGDVASSPTTVGPLLLSIRDQEEPYNLLCPYWTYEDSTVSERRCLSGCVATCIEQMMAYYRYPEALIDTLHGWQTDNYVIEDLLPGTRFDWDNYLLDYRDGWTEAQGMAIALPSLAAGMAVHMQYGLAASGANVYRAVEPLQRAFGYGMVRYFDRILYTPARWHAMLQHELRQGRPVAYVGHNMALSGHAFNIDGVDDRGFYHVNWGYNGNYDGWYDLDWLNPWEPADLEENGIAEGFFCNQGALFMHPSSDAVPLEPDSMALDALGVELESVDFLRQPDVQGYVAADFHFHNTGADSVTYTYEVLTYLPTDTAIFYQADYVGLAAINLAPGERRVQRTYLQFAEAGDRILGISHDDETIPFTMSVSVRKGTRPQLEWGTVGARNVSETTDITYTFSVPVTNRAASGYAGNLVTFCLYPDGGEAEDLRHYRVLSLQAGQTEPLSVTFSSLQPSTHYTLIVRCPWAVQAQTDFTTPSLSAISTLSPDPVPALAPKYDLGGRPVGAGFKGVILQAGRKMLQGN